MLTVYETISLMILFGTLLITLLAYIDRNNKRNKFTYVLDQCR